MNYYSGIWVNEEQIREDGDVGLLCSSGSFGQGSRRKKKGGMRFTG